MDITDHQVITEAENVRLRLLYSNLLSLQTRKEEIMNLLFQITKSYTPNTKSYLLNLTCEANDLLLLSS